MVKRYTAEIKPVNEDVIGSTVFGEAELVEVAIPYGSKSKQQVHRQT